MAPNEDGYAQAVIQSVRDLTQLVEEHKRSGDDARQQLLTNVELAVAGMRTDVHKAITSLQLNQVDHKAAHEADRMERIARQQQLDGQLSQQQQQVNAGLTEVRQQLNTSLDGIRRWMITGLVGIALAVGIAAGIALGQWLLP